MAYLLDSNVFIEGKNRYYDMEFCPAFWEWLVEANAAGRVQSIDQVSDELLEGDDELSQWVSERGAAFFAPIDPPVMPLLGRVSMWVTGQGFEPAAVTTFLQTADYYLIAVALAHGHTVVTNEIASASVKRIKIPTVCVGLGVKCVTPFTMLRLERARFVLGR